jgi:uncharacterized protein YdcH (DUF465 family)
LPVGRRTGTTGLIGGRQKGAGKAILILGDRDKTRLPPINKRRCSMPVNHDLYKDLGYTKEDIKQKYPNDPHLHSLLDQFTRIDAEVLKAEAAALADDELRKLKEKRVFIKRQISSQLMTKS